MKTNTPQSYPFIIFYDGQCALCHHSIQVLLKLDKKKILRYSSLGGKKIKTLEINTTIDSIVFYDRDEVYYKSTAILKIFSRLGGLWKIINIFYIFPLFIRDFSYDILAKYRYKIFGKIDTCSLPQEGDKRLFIP